MANGIRDALLTLAQNSVTVLPWFRRSAPSAVTETLSP